jgi:hypothetical protein
MAGKPLGDHPKPEKIECEKEANCKALCNYHWCEAHPKLRSKCCKTCAEPKVLPSISTRPQREQKLVEYVEDVYEDVDDETTSQRAVQSLEDLCLAFPTSTSMHNMPAELRRKQLNAGTKPILKNVDSGGGNAGKRKVQFGVNPINEYRFYEISSKTTEFQTKPAEGVNKGTLALSVIRGMGNARRAEETRVNLLCGIIEKCAAIILPGDPDFLLSGAMEMLRAKSSKPSLKRKAEVADKSVANMSA